MTEEAGILAEELGCSRRAAEKVFGLCGRNLNHAYRWLASKHRSIAILRIKFATRSTYHCGLMFVSVNTELKKSLRYAVSISRNPYVYAEDLDVPWYEFENRIYAQRLKEEIAHEKTISAAQSLRSFLQEPGSESFFAAVAGVDRAAFGDILRSVLRKILDEDIFFEFRKERISVFDFRRVAADSGTASDNHASREAKIELKVEPVRAKRRFLFVKGPAIDKIAPGELIFVKITDDRDISGYLIRLIGIPASEPIPVELLEKKKNSGGYSVTVRLGGMIRGFCEIPSGTPVEIFRG